MLTKLIFGAILKNMKTIQIKTDPTICFANTFSSPTYCNEFKPHYTYIEIIEVTEGKITVTANGKTRVACEGDIIFNFYEKSTSLTSDKFHSHISVCARVIWAESNSGLNIPYIIPKEHAGKISEMTSSLLLQRENSSKVFNSILSEADRIANEHFLSSKERYTKKAKGYIEEHIKEPLTQRQIASALGITPEYLCSIFKKTENTTLIHYINRKKLSAIVNDMQKEEIRLYEAAARYGYSDPHYVSRLYKKLFSENISAAVDKVTQQGGAPIIYKFDKSALPVPVYEGRDDYTELYYKTWELMFDNVNYTNKKGWKPMISCMPGVGMLWLWDSCFMTLFTNYCQSGIDALSNLDNLYRLQRADGYVSMAYRIENEAEAYGERINPPLFAWAEWEHYLISGDSSRFESVIPKIEALYNFIEKNRRHKNGLYFFEDASSSGMNGTPRGTAHSYDLGICFVDLACQQSLSALCMSKIFSVLGSTEKSEFYRQENERINSLINQHHYCEKTGFYYDLFITDLKTTVFISNKTAASFWVLLCGALQDSRFVDHVMSPDEFNTSTPFATLSKDDPNFRSEGGKWLGASRPQTTFVAIRGLYECGFSQYARESAKKYLDVIAQVANDARYGSIWECYSPDGARPAIKDTGLLAMSNFVGCAGVGPVTLFIENVIGLHFDAWNNTVTFEITHNKKSGIENMSFCGGKLSIVHDSSTVFVTSERPFTLITKKDGKQTEHAVPTGTSHFEV